MSDDLISRSALLEKINYYYTHTSNDFPKHYAYGVALKEIREHPAAFDKEKVIEELHNERNPIYREDGSLMSDRTYISIDNAIEIVEKGGIG